jgi:hypothetical protein
VRERYELVGSSQGQGECVVAWGRRRTGRSKVYFSRSAHEGWIAIRGTGAADVCRKVDERSCDPVKVVKSAM